MAHAPRKPSPKITSLQTSQLANASKRYSWTETPVELGRSRYRSPPVASPTATTIDESPISPASSGSRVLPIYTEGDLDDAPIREEKETVRSPQEVHPAYYAPVTEEMQLSHAQPPQDQTIIPASHPNPILEVTAATSLNAPSEVVHLPLSQQHHTSSQPQPLEPPPESTPAPRPVIEPDEYDPSSRQATNGGPPNHRPGQVSHPNAKTNPHWRHDICEPSSLCCLGIICPCMLYGKTTYRLSRKTQKQDPTDLLGYESCNGSCGLFAVACGFQWALAAIQRTRIRKFYDIEGDLATDCVKSLCCCCCVVAQNEREMKEREENYRRNAGPSTGYAIRSGMNYAPPPT